MRSPFPRLSLAALSTLILSGALAAQTPAVAEHCTAASPSLATYAVVRQPSHGASATCVYTTNGRSVLLGCAHAYEHGDARKAIVLDVLVPAAAAPVRAGPRLAAVDYRADLSLVELPAGPLPYVMPVAPAGWRPGPNVLACGYDQMRSLVRAPTHILCAMTYTLERPVPGRSGGALCDADAGLLLGVCHGYECNSNGSTGPQHRGMYVSHATIIAFLQARGYGWLADPRYTGAAARAPALTMPPTVQAPAPRPQTCPPGG